MSRNLFIGLLIFMFLLFGWMAVVSLGTPALLRQYQHQYGWDTNDITAVRVGRSWTGRGLIFHQATMTHWAVPHRIGRLVVRAQENVIHLTLNKVNIDIIAALQKQYGTRVVQELEQITPYMNALDRLITTMGIIGVDRFDGDLDVQIVYTSPTHRVVTFIITTGGKALATVQMTLIAPRPGVMRLDDVLMGEIQMADVTLHHADWVRRYIDYAAARGSDMPPMIQPTSHGVQMHISPQTPVRLMDVLR